MSRLDADSHAPRLMFWGVLLACITPLVLSMCGVRWEGRELSVERLSALINFEPENASARVLQLARPRIVYLLLEWTAGLIAIVTAGLAILQYVLRKDVVTAAIGTALFFAGMLDVLNASTAAGLIEHRASDQHFIPFTWFLSRGFHASILLLGVAPFALGSRTRERAGYGSRAIAFSTVIFGFGAYSIFAICAMVEQLPIVIVPRWIIVRPWDAIPLCLYLIAAGSVLPRFMKRKPGRFADAILISTIPHVVAQMHVCFGGTTLFAQDVYTASALKVVGYLVPLLGLLFDFEKAHRAEALVYSTRQKLHVARTVQDELLPTERPGVAGFDIDGYSIAANEIGGDYFDYVPMTKGRTAIIVGDVSGHDIGSAVLLSQTRAWLRARATVADDASALLFGLGQFLCDEVRSTRFICLLCAVIEPESDTVAVLCMGHEATLVRTSGTREQIESHGPPLGLSSPSTAPVPTTVEMSSDDVLIFVTDGVLETMSPQGEQFGPERTADTVAGANQQKVSETLADLRRSIELFSNHMPQTDDLTAVLIRRAAKTEVEDRTDDES